MSRGTRAPSPLRVPKIFFLINLMRPFKETSRGELVLVSSGHLNVFFQSNYYGFSPPLFASFLLSLIYFLLGFNYANLSTFFEEAA